MLWNADRQLDDLGTGTSQVSYVRGDATIPRGAGAKVVVQVVNDGTPNWGGGGFASAVRRAFPQVQAEFKDWWEIETKGKKRLGLVHMSEVSHGVWVISIVAQHGYGSSPTPRIRYTALREGLIQVAAHAASRRASVHMPRIACGQAGGSWPVVEELVRDIILSRGLAVTVYDRPGATLSEATVVQPSLGL
jgi:hypothetical protein